MRRWGMDSPSIGAGIRDGDQTSLSVAMRDDPSRLLITYPIRNGLIEGDGEVDLHLMPISELVRASGPDSAYDLVETSTLSLAQAAIRGDSTIMTTACLRDRGSVMLFVKADSSIQTVEDLKGTSVARQPGGASSVLVLRYVLEHKFRIDPDEDLAWVELPDGEMADALRSGDVAAAMLNSYHGWQALNDKSLDLLYTATEDFGALAGGLPMNTGLLTGVAVYQAKKARVDALNRLLRSAADYVGHNRGPVFEAVAATTGVPSDYLDWWWEAFDQLWGGIRAEYRPGIMALWRAGHLSGLLEFVPSNLDDYLLIEPA